jgi:phospholipid-transporting ATPase
LVDVDIKVWMLTGDKMETAENIAKSCRLIQADFHILRLKLGSKLPKADDAVGDK